MSWTRRTVLFLVGLLAGIVLWNVLMIWKEGRAREAYHENHRLRMLEASTEEERRAEMQRYSEMMGSSAFWWRLEHQLWKECQSDINSMRRRHAEQLLEEVRLCRMR